MDELCRCIMGPFIATYESSTASGCSPLRMGVDSKVRCATSHVSVRPRYEAVIAAGEGRVRFLDEFTSSELIKTRTRTRYSFSNESKVNEKLVIFENDPFSKHWRTA